MRSARDPRWSRRVEQLWSTTEMLIRASWSLWDESIWVVLGWFVPPSPSLVIVGHIVSRKTVLRREVPKGALEGWEEPIQDGCVRSEEYPAHA